MMSTKPNPIRDDEGQTPNRTDQGDNPAGGSTPDQGQGKTTQKQPTGGAGSKPKVDYKKKFSNSTRESQIKDKRINTLAQENAILKAKLVKKDASEPLTEEGYVELNPEYELMDESGKTRFRKQVENDRLLHELAAKNKWQEEYSDLPGNLVQMIVDKGGERAFKDFACKPENAGQKSLENLAKSFLYEPGTTDDDDDDDNPPIDSALETGTGGDGKPVKVKVENEYTQEEANNMRLNDPKKYADLVATGKINIKPFKE